MDLNCQDCGSPLQCRPGGGGLHDFDCPKCSPELFEEVSTYKSESSDKIVNWNQLAAKIVKMTPEERMNPVLTFDDNEGKFCKLIKLEKWDDEDASCYGTHYLEQDNRWYDEQESQV